MFKKIASVFSYLLFVVGCRMVVLKNKLSGKNISVTGKGQRYADYLVKVLNDNSYTYDDYTELSFYNILNDACKEMETDDREEVALLQLSVLFPYIMSGKVSNE